MARTPKAPQPITQRTIAEAAITLADISQTLQLAAESISEGESLMVVYGKSLERGMASLEAVAPQIRKAVALRNAGLPHDPGPQQPGKKPPKIPGVMSAAEIPESQSTDVPDQPVGRKKKARRKGSTQKEVDSARKAEKKGGRKKAGGA